MGERDAFPTLTPSTSPERSFIGTVSCIAFMTTRHVLLFCHLYCWWMCAAGPTPRDMPQLLDDSVSDEKITQLLFPSAAAGSSGELRPVVDNSVTRKATWCWR